MLPFINIFGRELSTYTLMTMLGIFAMIFVAKITSKKFHVDLNDMLITGLWAAVGVFIGGHLLYGLTNFDFIIYTFNNLDKITSFKLFIDTFLAIFGGQVFYGGLIGGIIAGMLYLKKSKKDVDLYAYLFAPLIPLFHGFGRIGCFCAGCCFGIPHEHGVTFHDSTIPMANDVPRLPIQLIEAALNFILFGVLLYLQRKGKCKNILLYVYLASYSVIRFVDEFFRGDTYRGFIGPLSTSQFISVLLLIFSIIMIVIKLKKSKKTAKTKTLKKQASKGVKSSRTA